MNSHWHHMMESLFDSRSWQQLDTEQLKRMTLEYPYFPITQFMYARKLKLDQHSAYPEQAAKTAIFFTNPYWLNWQMNMDKYVEEPVKQKAEAKVESVPVAEDPIIDEEVRESYIDQVEREHDHHVTPEIETEHLETTTVETSAEPNHLPASEPVIEAPVASEQLSIPENEQPKATEIPKADEPLIPIEPLFATDYFASQGIKLSQAEETADRLGQKLKSFTEWLKTMKRAQPKNAESLPADISDQKIQRIAETSNEARDVLTETMAEVLVLQGLKDKAIEVYQKLSLLNPQKSAYFAAKIEEIKVV